MQLWTMPMLIVDKKEVNQRKRQRERLIVLISLSRLIYWTNILKPDPYMQLSPLSTLESSFEALNVKKFDGKEIFLLILL